jgi:hypothetical protein
MIQKLKTTSPELTQAAIMDKLVAYSSDQVSVLGQGVELKPQQPSRCESKPNSASLQVQEQFSGVKERERDC